MTSPHASILVVGADGFNREDLAGQDFEVTLVDDGPQALDLLKQNQFDLALVDLQSAGLEGLRTLEAMKSLDPSLEVIVTTVSSDIETAIASVQGGAYDYLIKPYPRAELRFTLGRAMEKCNLERINLLYEASTTLLGTPNPEDLLDLALSLAGHVLKTSEMGLAVLRTDRDGYHLYRSSQSQKYSDTLLAPFVQRALEADKPLFLRFEPTEGDSAHLALNQADAGYAFPLHVGDRHLGALVMVREISLPAFTPANLQQGKFLASQIALALDNARLYSELSKAEERTRLNEGRLQAIVNAAFDGIITLDRKLSIVAMNPEGERIFDRSSVKAAGLPFLMLVDQLGKRDGTLREARGIEARVILPDGPSRPVELSITEFETADGGGFVSFVRDVSETKRIEVELRHSQKLEAVGRLSAGISHEINTPTQYVGDSIHFLKGAFADLATMIAAYQALLGSAVEARFGPEEIARREEAEEDADLEYLMENVPRAIDRALDGVSRVATIVQAMKQFAYPDREEKSSADLNKGILSTLAVANSEIKYLAKVSTDLGDLPPVICHIGDLNQVVLNLLVNAAHAIEDNHQPSGSMGSIHIRTVQEGECVLITVRDSGSGIPEAIREKIFEPFFTSKTVGRGTGQGLALARAIVVDKHGGEIWFESEQGLGTTFFIRLPINGGEGTR